MDQTGNWLFEVVTVEQDDSTQFFSNAASNNVPIKVKIRVKKRDATGGPTQGVISLPKMKHTKGYPEKIRVVHSDQTIMSFNMITEPELQTKQHRISQNKFFHLFKTGKCLRTQGEDNNDPPYMITTTSIKSNKNKSKDQILLESGVENENLNFSSHKNNLRTSEDASLFFFGKCKRGGCLDPPFGEDKYKYQPLIHSKLQPNLLENQKYQKVNCEKVNVNINKNSVVTDKPSILMTINPDETSNLSTRMLFKAKSEKCSLDEKYSDSIITYPAETVPGRRGIDVNDKSLSSKKNRQSNYCTDSCFTPSTIKRSPERYKEKDKMTKKEFNDINHSLEISSSDFKENSSLLQNKLYSTIETSKIISSDNTILQLQAVVTENILLNQIKEKREVRDKRIDVNEFNSVPLPKDKVQRHLFSQKDLQKISKDAEQFNTFSQTNSQVKNHLTESIQETKLNTEEINKNNISSTEGQDIISLVETVNPQAVDKPLAISNRKETLYKYINIPNIQPATEEMFQYSNYKINQTLSYDHLEQIKHRSPNYSDNIENLKYEKIDITQTNTQSISGLCKSRESEDLYKYNSKIYIACNSIRSNNNLDIFNKKILQTSTDSKTDNSKHFAVLKYKNENEKDVDDNLQTSNLILEITEKESTKKIQLQKQNSDIKLMSPGNINDVESKYADHKTNSESNESIEKSNDIYFSEETRTVSLDESSIRSATNSDRNIKDEQLQNNILVCQNLEPRDINEISDINDMTQRNMNLRENIGKENFHKNSTITNNLFDDITFGKKDTLPTPGVKNVYDANFSENNDNIDSEIRHTKESESVPFLTYRSNFNNLLPEKIASVDVQDMLHASVKDYTLPISEIIDRSNEIVADNDKITKKSNIEKITKDIIQTDLSLENVTPKNISQDILTITASTVQTSEENPNEKYDNLTYRNQSEIDFLNDQTNNHNQFYQFNVIDNIETTNNPKEQNINNNMVSTSDNQTLLPTSRISNRSIPTIKTLNKNDHLGISKQSLIDPSSKLFSNFNLIKEDTFSHDKTSTVNPANQKTISYTSVLSKKKQEFIINDKFSLSEQTLSLSFSKNKNDKKIEINDKTKTSKWMQLDNKETEKPKTASEDILTKNMIIALGFQSYINDSNETVLRTFDISKNPERFPQDSISVIKTVLNFNDSKVSFTMNSETNLSIDIYKNNKSINVEDKKIENEDPKIKIKHFNTRDVEKLQKSLVTIYENNLVPVQKLIKSLILEIENVNKCCAQKKRKLAATKKFKIPKCSFANTNCGCIRK